MQSEDDEALSGVPLTALCYDMETRLLISGDQSGTVSYLQADCRSRLRFN